MKKFILVILVLTIFSCLNSQNDKTLDNNQGTTTYYFVRHAEKDVTPANNPRLLAAGKARAKQYASFFKNKDLDFVYSTNFTRTKNTAKPTADSKNIKTIIYDPFKINYDAFKAKTKGKTVFVVGHSNTIPGFVNRIIGENTYQEIDESIYGNMYIVTITNGEIKHELKQ